MQMAEGKRDLCRKEASLGFLEPLNLHQVSVELTPVDELHDEVDAELILEHVLHIH